MRKLVIRSLLAAIAVVFFGFPVLLPGTKGIAIKTVGIYEAYAFQECNDYTCYSDPEEETSECIKWEVAYCAMTGENSCGGDPCQPQP